MTKDAAAIRDQLGRNPPVFPTLVSGFDETLALEEGPTKTETNSIGTSFILGHPVNGVLGTSTLGEAGRVLVLVRIVNPNRIFHEHFRTTLYKGVPFTADWNTTLFRLAMTTETSKAQLYNKVATFTSIAFNDGTVVRATVVCTETKFANDLIRYFMRTDPSNDWEEVTKGVEHNFTNAGVNLQLRVIMIGNGANETFLEDLDVAYEI